MEKLYAQKTLPKRTWVKKSKAPTFQTGYFCDMLDWSTKTLIYVLYKYSTLIHSLMSRPILYVYIAESCDVCFPKGHTHYEGSNIFFMWYKCAFSHLNLSRLLIHPFPLLLLLHLIWKKKTMIISIVYSSMITDVKTYCFGELLRPISKRIAKKE